MRENSYAKFSTIVILGGGVKQTKQGGLRIYIYILDIFQKYSHSDYHFFSVSWVVFD